MLRRTSRRLLPRTRSGDATSDPAVAALVELLESERDLALAEERGLVERFDPGQVWLLWFAIGATDEICRLIERDPQDEGTRIFRQLVGVIFGRRVRSETNPVLADRRLIELFEGAGAEAVRDCMRGEARLGHYLTHCVSARAGSAELTQGRCALRTGLHAAGAPRSIVAARAVRPTPARPVPGVNRWIPTALFPDVPCAASGAGAWRATRSMHASSSRCGRCWLTSAPTFEDRPSPQVGDFILPAPRIRPPAALAEQFSASPLDRLNHCAGKSYADCARMWLRTPPSPPDWVAYPEDERAVVDILDWAQANNVAVIPYGGGSSVCGGVEAAVGPRLCGRRLARSRAPQSRARSGPGQPRRAHPGRRTGA